MSGTSYGNSGPFGWVPGLSAFDSHRYGLFELNPATLTTLDNLPRKDNIASPSVRYFDMLPHWILPDDLLDRTIGMRRRAASWLPQEDGEPDTDYNQRVGRSFLFNGYEETLDNIASKPFTETVKWSDPEAIPDDLAYLEKNCDNQGTPWHDFWRQVFRFGVHYGLHHVLIDYPAGVSGLSKREEELREIRPYLVHIRANDLLYWKEETIDGHLFVREIRYKVAGIESKGGSNFKDTVDHKIRQHTFVTPFEYSPEGGNMRGEVTEHTLVGGEWLAGESSKHDFEGVPLCTHYTNKTANMMANPTLENLAWLNLNLYQSDADQNDGLHFARFATLMIAGIDEDAAEGQARVGPRRTMYSNRSPQEFDMKYVESAGTAFEAGRNHAIDLKEMMEALAAEPFMVDKVAVTATKEGIKESRGKSKIEQWVVSAEMCGGMALRACAQWTSTNKRRVEIPDDLRMVLFSDFRQPVVGAGDSEALHRMFTDKAIRRLTYLMEMQNRGLLSEDVDPAEEDAAMEAMVKEERERMEAQLALDRDPSASGEDDDAGDDDSEDDQESEGEEDVD